MGPLRQPDSSHPRCWVPSLPRRAGQGRRRRRLQRFVAVVCAVLVVLALLPSVAVNPLAGWVARDRLAGCLVTTGLEVDTGAWPPLARAALLGELREVRLAAERITATGITVRDVSARFDRISGDVLRGSRVEVSGGELRAVLREADLSAALPLPAAAVQIDAGGVRIAGLGWPLGAAPAVVVVEAEAGDLVVRPSVLGVRGPLSLRLSLPEPVWLTGVRAETGQLVLRATLDGVVDLGRLGC